MLLSTPPGRPAVLQRAAHRNFDAASAATIASSATVSAKSFVANRSSPSVRRAPLLRYSLSGRHPVVSLPAWIGDTRSKSPACWRLRHSSAGLYERPGDIAEMEPCGHRAESGIVRRSLSSVMWRAVRNTVRSVLYQKPPERGSRFCVRGPIRFATVHHHADSVGVADGPFELWAGRSPLTPTPCTWRQITGESSRTRGGGRRGHRSAGKCGQF